MNKPVLRRSRKSKVGTRSRASPARGRRGQQSRTGAGRFSLRVYSEQCAFRRCRLASSDAAATARGARSGPHSKTFHEIPMRIPRSARSFRADALAWVQRDPACDRLIEPLIYFKGYHALQIHRIGHRLWNAGRKDFALYLQSLVSRFLQVDIHPVARIGRAIMIVIMRPASSSAKRPSWATIARCFMPSRLVDRETSMGTGIPRSAAA